MSKDALEGEEALAYGQVSPRVQQAIESQRRKALKQTAMDAKQSKVSRFREKDLAGKA